MKEKLKSEYRNWLINRSLAPKTISENVRRIDLFLSFIDCDIEKITEETISNWFLELRKKC